MLAGLVVFAWGFVWHTWVPLGSSQIKTLRAEGPVLGTLQSLITEPGFYIFPGMEPGAKRTAEQQQEDAARYLDNYATGPHGILVYTPANGPLNFPRLLVNELLSNFAGGLIAAVLLAMALPGLPRFVTRVMFVGLLGLFASLAIDVSYWNWYGFPGGFTLAALADQAIGWTLAGLVLAGLLKPGPVPARV